MDLAIHILTAATMVGAGVALVFLYRLVYQLEIIIERMNKRIEKMKEHEVQLEAIAEKLYKEVTDDSEENRTIFDDLADALHEAFKSPKAKKPIINVDDKPLDFPNDSAK